jgi:hypothetical protein
MACGGGTRGNDSCAVGERRGGGASRDEGNEKLHVHVEQKETRLFPDPTYIRQLTDKYRRACTNNQRI